MNVTEPANLEKEGERERRKYCRLAETPSTYPLYTKGAISSCHNKCKLGKAHKPACLFS